MKCRWCGLDHPEGAASETRRWIACREAQGNLIYILTQAVNDLREAMEKIRQLTFKDDDRSFKSYTSTPLDEKRMKWASIQSIAAEALRKSSR